MSDCSYVPRCRIFDPESSLTVASSSPVRVQSSGLEVTSLTFLLIGTAIAAGAATRNCSPNKKGSLLKCELFVGGGGGAGGRRKELD